MLSKGDTLGFGEKYFNLVTLYFGKWSKNVMILLTFIDTVISQQSLNVQPWSQLAYPF